MRIKMDENIFDKINEVDLKKTMETSYIDYAMSVIAARALPDVRDGLKPVQRRILYAMAELNNSKNTSTVDNLVEKYNDGAKSAAVDAELEALKASLGMTSGEGGAQ